MEITNIDKLTLSELNKQGYKVNPYPFIFDYRKGIVFEKCVRTLVNHRGLGERVQDYYRTERGDKFAKEIKL